MKHIAAIVGFFFLLSPISAQRVVTAPGTFADLVYVPARDAVYAVRPAADPEGNTLCRIDLTTGLPVDCVVVGADPYRVVATTSGDYLYLAFRGENRVKRFSLLTGSIDREFTVGGEEAFDGPYYPDDLLPVRGSDDRIAISRQKLFTTPRFAGVVLFDGDRRLPEGETDFPGSNTLAYTDLDDVLIGYSSEGDLQLRSLALGENGLSVSNSYQGYYSAYGRLEYANGRLYSPTGEVVDLNNGVPGNIFSVYPDGLATYNYLAVEPLPEAELIYYLGSDGDGRLALGAYDITNFTRVSVTTLNPYANPYTGEAGQVLEALGTTDRFAYVSTLGILGIVTLCTSTLTEVPPPYEGPMYICGNTPLDVIAPTGDRAAGQEVIWSTGAIGDTLRVTETGFYRYRLTDASGCPGPFSPEFYINQIDGLDYPPQILEPRSSVLCTDGSVTLTAEYPYGTTIIWNTGDTTTQLTVTAPGNYTAYAIEENSQCPSGRSAPFTVTAVDRPSPDVPVVEPGLLIDTCTVNPINLSVREPDGAYFWDFRFAYTIQPDGASSVIVYPNYDPVAFSVTVRDAFGCLSDPAEGSIIFRYPPDPTTLQYNAATNTLASTLPGPLLWYYQDELEGESAGRFYRPLRNGFYTARVKGSECLSEASNIVSVDGVTTSVHDDVASALVSVYPVPARGVVYVSVDKQLAVGRPGETVRYRLFSSAGSLVSEGRLDPRLSNNPIFIDGMAAGVYVLNLDSRERGIIRKRITVF